MIRTLDRLLTSRRTRCDGKAVQIPGTAVACLLVLVSIVAAVGAAHDPPAFSVNEAIERASSNPRPTSTDISIIERWMRAPATSFLSEFMIDTSKGYWLAPRPQAYPDVVFNGTNYLVVWRDDRIGDFGGRWWNLFAGRVDTSGKVLDPSGKLIFTDYYWARYSTVPSVASDGTNCFLVWRFGSGSPDYIDGILGTRLDSSASPVDTPFLLYQKWDADIRPSVAYGQGIYLVVWSEYPYGDPYLKALRVDTSGVLLDPSPIAVCTTTCVQEYPDVIFDGTNFLVVWGDYRSGNLDIYGTRVSPSGTVIDPAGIAISQATDIQRTPSVAFDGENYLVVWRDLRSDPEGDIYGARVSPSGVVLDTSGMAICTTGAKQDYWPSVAFGDNTYLVLWKDFRNDSNGEIFCARVDTSGMVLDPDGRAVSGDLGTEFYTRVCFGNARYFSVWNRIGGDVYGARIDTSGAVLDTSGIPISTAAATQGNPAVAFDGTNYLAAWQDWRLRDESDIYASRVDASGNPLDIPAIPLCTSSGDQLVPSAAFGGSSYLVVWQDTRHGIEHRIYGARMDTQGIVLDTSGFRICEIESHQAFPCVSSDGTGYLVAWDDFRNGTWEIYAARVDSSGAVLDPSGIFITPVGGPNAPCVAFGVENYLVVWKEGSLVRGVRMNFFGEILDSTSISLPPDCWDDPAVAYGALQYLVVWERHIGGEADIYGARVDTSGTVLDSASIRIGTLGGYGCYPSVAFDGDCYLVAWDRISSICGAKVYTSGEVGPVETLTDYSAPYFRRNPSIVQGRPNQLLMVYDGYTPEPYQSIRVFGALYGQVGVQEGPPRSGSLAGGIVLRQNVPNPFRRSTVISYSLPQAAQVTLDIYDITGRLIELLVDEAKQPGIHQVRWNRKDNPNGVYFYKLRVGEFADIRKMVVID